MFEDGSFHNVLEYTKGKHRLSDIYLAQPYSAILLHDFIVSEHDVYNINESYSVKLCSWSIGGQRRLRSVCASVVAHTDLDLRCSQFAQRPLYLC